MTITKSGSGTVTPSSSFTVKYGGSASVAVNAAAGNRIKSVAVGGSPVPAAAGKAAYLMALSNLTASTSVDVFFEAIPGVTVTATAGAGGAVSPPTQSVAHGGNATVSVTADSGYAISNVTVNGVSKPAAVGATSYTVSLVDLTADVAVNATFVPVEPPPDNLVEFGDGSIAIIFDEEHPLAFGAIDFSGASASVTLVATLEAEPGATPQPAWLLVKPSLDSVSTYTLGGEIDANGMAAFTIPDGYNQIFIVGITNAEGVHLE